MRFTAILLISIVILFGLGCRTKEIELIAKNLGSEKITESEGDFAGNGFRWGVLVPKANKGAHFYDLRYRTETCKVRFRRADGKLVEKSIDMSQRIEWLKANCKGKRGIRVIFNFHPETETVDIDVSCIERRRTQAL